MGKNINEIDRNLERRTLGLHLTSKDVFLKYIFPEIENKLWRYKWIDLYAGEGNLILPILDSISPEKRLQFFKNNIYLYDVQSEMVQKCIENAKSYGIPYNIAINNIKLRDNLESFPDFLKNSNLPLYHITNPPYLYLGYIRKHQETQKYLPLFSGNNEGYQDLYQIAMINDLRNQIENLIYIIPSNFLFGSSVSNKFRFDFLKHYKIDKMVIIETRVFKHTGTNVCIGFFQRKHKPTSEDLEFKGLKIKKQNKIVEKNYVLKPEFKYRAGSEFEEFIKEYRVENPVCVDYYLLKKEVIENKGNNEICVIDANKYQNNEYKKIILQISNTLKQKIESNILYIRTVDTGSYNGRVGLGIISEDFNVKGVYVSGNTYRTHPIQIFIEPPISHNDQKLLKNYFNFILEVFRENLDSEFLTTYKYSKAEYTRKYLGLTQVRKLIETLPVLQFDVKNKEKLIDLIEGGDYQEVFKLLKKFKNLKELSS